MNNSKKITWKQILHAIIQAGHSSAHRLGRNQLHHSLLKSPLAHRMTLFNSLFQFNHDSRNFPYDNR